MTQKDWIHRAGRAYPSWKKAAGLAFGLLVIIGVCVIVRLATPNRSVEADQPTAGSTAPTAATAPAPVEPKADALRQLPPSKPFSTSPIAAEVNDRQITRQQLAVECSRRFGKEVLETMVNRRIIEMACKEQGILITRQEIDAEIGRMAERFQLDTARWLQLLEEERGIGLEEYREEIVWPTLALRRLAADQLTVGQEEIDRAFETEFGPMVRVRIISASSKEKAEEILARVKADPESFETVAKNESEDAYSASARGLIPPIRRHAGDPDIERIAFGLKEGEISPIIFTANQYIILKCESHIAARPVPPQNRQILEARLVEKIRDTKVRRTAGEAFEKLQARAKVVNILNDEELSKKTPGVAATVNGEPITLVDLYELCIKRHGADVLEGEINRELLMQALEKRGAKVVEEDIDAEIARAAESYGCIKADKSPDIETWLKQITEQQKITVDLYVRDIVWPTVALKKLVDDKIDISEEDLQKSFVANYGPRVRVLAIVLSDQQTAQEVWEMARRNPTEEFFAELAGQYSVDPASAANRGLVPPIRQYGGQPAIEKEAFALKPGDISAIIVSADKFLILRCLGHTKQVVTDIAEVRDDLVKDIHEKKLRLEMAKRFETLQGTARIDNYLTGETQAGRQAQPKNAAAPIGPATPVAPVGTGAAAARTAQLPAPAGARR